MNNNKIKILIADDEPDILEILQYNLRKEGFSVHTTKESRQVLTLARSFRPDLIILDIMMPEQDGVETCKELRSLKEFDDTLIVFLTARSEDYSQIVALEEGADDYIIKPVSPRVLVARLKALLTRKEKTLPAPNGNGSKPIGLLIDEEKYLVYKNGKAIQLARKEFELLSLLASVPGKVFSRSDIFTRVWGEPFRLNDRTIDVHIRKIREKIGDPHIRTIKGIGYKFEVQL